MWPNQMPQPGSSESRSAASGRAACAPASVPQNEPMPPMITASNANSSSAGPSAGDTVVRIACSTPATAISTKAMAVASA